MARMLEEIDIGDVPVPELIDRIRERGTFVFDLETTGLDCLKDKIEGIAIYVPEGEKNPPMRAWYPFIEDTMLQYVQPDESPDEQHARIRYERTSEPEDKQVWERLRQQPVIKNLRPALVQRDVMEGLRPIFEDHPDLTGIAHNAKFDIGFLIHSSGADRGILMNMLLADSMLLDFIGDENAYQYGLKQRVKEFFGHEMVTYEDAARLKRQAVLPFMSDSVQPLGIYAMEDVYWTWKLYEMCLDRLTTEDETGRLEKIFWGIDMKVCRILNEMECAGVLIDWRWLRQVSKNLETEKDEILTRIEHRVGGPLNPKSPPQVSTLLFGPKEGGNLGLATKAVKQGKSGLYSTGSKEIGHLRRADSLVADILDWRSLDTVKTGFADKIGLLAQEAHDGRVHAHFNQTGTVIFRLSSSDPFNFQNQPRDRNLIRKAFCAHYPEEVEEIKKIVEMVERKVREDELMLLFGADYSQIELRVAAHLSGDKNMIEVYSSVGGCHAEEGNPCLRFKHWVCDDCDKKDKTKDRVESVYLPILQPGQTEPEKKCPRCSGKKVKHQKRCRHVDLHQRTAEDVGVERDPLSKCLDGRTLLSASIDGKPRLLTIKSLFGTACPDPVPGEHRLVYDGASYQVVDGRGGWVSLKSGLVRPARSTKIVVTKRTVVVATDDHRFQVIGDGMGTLAPNTRGYKHVVGMSLVEAAKLEKGMKLPLGDAAHPRAMEPEFHRERSPMEVKLNPFTKEIGDGPATISLDERWAYFAGMFAGDGCASGNSCVITHGHTSDYESWRQTVRSACDSIGLPTSLSGDKRSTRIGSRAVRHYFAGLGLCREKEHRSGEKIMEIPQWVFDGGPSIMWSYLAGLFDTDGTVGKARAGTASVTTKHPEFAGQVAMLLRWLGMPILVQPSFNKTYERWYYAIHVLGEGLERFQTHCPLRRCDKVERLTERNETIKRRCAPSDDEVLLVLDGGEREVFDFHVESDDHLYLQGGLIGHNNLNFGNLYRIGPDRFCQYADLYDENGDPRVEYAASVQKGWHAAYPGIHPFHVMTERYLREHGWVAMTLTGRRRRLNQARFSEGEYRAVTQGIQFQVSGSAQDIIKVAMIHIIEERDKKIANAGPAEKRLWRKVRLLIQVHDELVGECPAVLKPEIKEMVDRNMKGAAQLKVPLDASTKFGQHWDDIH